MNFSEEHNPLKDPTYQLLLDELSTYHHELLKIDDKLANNPVLAGEYQGKLRLGVSKLFDYLNDYIDLQIETAEEYSFTRQNVYKEQLLLGKSPSAAEKQAVETTRVLATNEATAKLRVQQIKNNWEKYNSIAIYLATRMKEFDTERRMG